MKNLVLGFLALTLARWVVAAAQASPQQSSNQQNQTDQNQANTKGSQNMSGNVSANGKNFVSDKDNKKYKVDNPDALKDHEGQHVAIIVRVDPDRGDLHIMQVELPEQLMRIARRRRSDSRQKLLIPWEWRVTSYVNRRGYPD